METALYFPYIRVPQTPWFTQVLLYWEQAAAIVPRSFLRPESHDIPPYMDELAKAGLLEYVLPDEQPLAVWPLSQEFQNGFLELLGDTKGPIPRSSSDKETIRVPFSKVHISKLPYGLFEELHSRCLAAREEGEEAESWWRIETTTADMYMAYLASAISGARSDTYPVTDSEVSMATLDGGAQEDVKQRLSALRYRVITQALPAPLGQVAARELQDFKEKNSEQLKRCRKYLDGKLADLAAMTDDELRHVKTESLMQEIQDDVDQLRERMQKRKWPKVILVGVGGVVGAGLSVAGTVVTGGAALALGLAVAGGVIAASGPADRVAELMKKPRYNQKAPLAYAALGASLGQASWWRRLARILPWVRGH
jgi:hypothetical protein